MWWETITKTSCFNGCKTTRRTIPQTVQIPNEMTISVLTLPKAPSYDTITPHTTLPLSLEQKTQVITPPPPNVTPITSIPPTTALKTQHSSSHPQRHILPPKRVFLFHPLLTPPRRLLLSNHKVAVHVLDALAQEQHLVRGLGAVVAAEGRDELGEVAVALDADVRGVVGEVLAVPG